MKFRILSALVVAGFVALNTSPASASFSVTLTDGALNTQTFSTVQADGTIVIKLSDITNAGLAADFTSFNLTANPNGSTLTLASVNTTQILLTKTSLLSSLHVVVADDFITPVGPLLSVFNTVGVSSADPTSGTATATQSTFINTVNATGPAVATVTGFGTDSHASANPTFAPVPLPPPFTMKTDVSIAFVAPNFNGTIQSNSSALGAPNATIPEPASVLVWGGLMAVGLIGSIGRGRIRRFS